MIWPVASPTGALGFDHRKNHSRHHHDRARNQYGPVNNGVAQLFISKFLDQVLHDINLAN